MCPLLSMHQSNDNRMHRMNVTLIENGYCSILLYLQGKLQQHGHGGHKMNLHRQTAV